MLNSENFFTQKNAGQKLTNHAKSSFLRADLIARDFEYEKIKNIHLLYAIFLEKGSVGANILADLGFKEVDFQKTLRENTERITIISGQPLLSSPEIKKTFTQAFSLAKEFNYPYVGTEHLVYTLLNAIDLLTKKLFANSKAKKDSQNLQLLFEPKELSHLSQMFNLPDIALGQKQKNSSSKTPFVDKFCINVNQEAKEKSDIIIGREKEISRMINILGRRNKNNPLLIGDPGVGKTALITGLANLINAGSVPNWLYGKKIMNLDVAQLIAGTSFRGEFEARLKNIIDEVSKNKNIILFIDEIHNIVGAGNVPGSLDLANIIKPALARGEMQLIGATTFSEYKKYIEKDQALERRFQPVNIAEPTEKETKKILFGIKEAYENFHNVSLSNEALNLAVDLSVRYVQNRFLPDKAIDVIDETASHIRSKAKISDNISQIRILENKQAALLEEKEKLVASDKFEEAIELRSQEKTLEQELKSLQEKQTKLEKENRIAITSFDIIETIAKISGIPAEKLAEVKNEKIKNIKKILNAKIIGQNEVLEKLASAILRSQSGISNPERPLGSFLFLGPTGVGKTLTAKILAQEFFGMEKSLIRIDMSELMERHSVSSLIGSPAGYIGYGEGGNLTEKVRRNPYSVVLFDEIEKAHPDVFNILLQILEDGHLTDAEGTRVSFKNTIVILTSNVGTSEFTNASEVGFGSKKNTHEISEKFNQIKETTLKELERCVRPELLNRLDHILVFNALTKEDIFKIVKLELERLKKVLMDKKIILNYPKNVLIFLTEKSLAFNQGARLVRKNTQELLENPIAEMIIYDKVKNGKIKAEIKNKKIILH